MTIVKICGLSAVEHALAAVEAGADLLGFVFAPSRRQVQPAAVVVIAHAVRAATLTIERWVSLVGVFVNEAPGRMLAVAHECGLDALQLSGTEDVATMQRLPDQMLLKAVRLKGASVEQGWLRMALPQRLHLLVDAHVSDSYGGAGVLADWDHAAALARQHPIILAGGLNPTNVAEAIRYVRPWGVDVSSGVETNGVKDIAKIRAFVSAVRVVDAELESDPEHVPPPPTSL